MGLKDGHGPSWWGVRAEGRAARLSSEAQVEGDTEEDRFLAEQVRLAEIEDAAEEERMMAEAKRLGAFEDAKREAVFARAEAWVKAEEERKKAMKVADEGAAEERAAGFASTAAQLPLRPNVPVPVPGGQSPTRTARCIEANVYLTQLLHRSRD